MINFIGLGINDNYQAKVKIYDENKLIYDGTTYNGKLKIKLKNKAYSLIATFLNQTIYAVIYPKKCITLSFNNIEPVTFILRDLYYNIPIERGEIVLWPR